MKKTIHIFFILSFLCVWCGNLLAQDTEHSIGLAPYQIGIEKGQPQYVPNENGPAANTAYGTDALLYNFLSMPIPAGTPFTIINPAFSSGDWLTGADMNDAGNFYGIEFYSKILYQVNLATGVKTAVGPVTGTVQTITGLAYNSANSTWYVCETDIATSKLYTINIATGAATYVGDITNCAAAIGLAINCTGNAYAVDIVGNNLYSVNLTTGAGTLVGALGFDPNYAQDCDFDAATGTLYLASYDGSAGASLRTCNTTTGGTTIVTPWPGSEIDGFAIDNTCGPPCPVGAPSNPNPPNGATGLPLNGNTASWTNGAGTVNVELWFGPAGNVVKVYDGAAITSYGLPNLNYATTYYWYVVCKDATCGTQGPGWSFTTMQDPNLVQWCDDFASLGNWVWVRRGE